MTTSTRQRSHAVQVDAVGADRPPASVVDLAPVDPDAAVVSPQRAGTLQKAEAAVARASAALGDAKSADAGSAQKADELNDALRALALTDDAERVAAWLSESLDQRAFEELAAEDGWTSRAVATEVLIALGYPHALKVSPEDLEHLRAVQRRARHASGPMAMLRSRTGQAVTVMVACSAVAMLSAVRAGAPWTGIAAIASLGLGAGAWFAVRRPAARQAIAKAMVGAGAVALGAAFLFGAAPAIGVIGAAAAVAGWALHGARTR